MRAATLIRALVVAAVALAAAETASAEVLTLVCRVVVTKGAERRPMERRLDIDLGRRTVRISDNLGRGWAFKNEYPIVSASRDRIQLEAGAAKESNVDRVSGQYAFRNQADGVTMQGPCQRATPERPRF